MSEFLTQYDAWCKEGMRPYEGALPLLPPPGTIHPTVEAMRTTRQTRDFMADGKRVHWHNEAMPTQEEWQRGIFRVFPDGHRYIDGWPHIDDRTHALRVCNRDIRVPWAELGNDAARVPIVVPFASMTDNDAGFCPSCLRLTSVWDILWQAAYHSWNTVETYRRHWEQCTFNADRLHNIVSYSWPYRLFIRRDGSWRIVNVETDDIPHDALSWCGLVSDSVKDMTYSLVGTIGNLHSSSATQPFADEAVFSLPTVDLTPARFLDIEYRALEGWAFRNCRLAGGYLTAVAYAEQLDRIGNARGVFDSTPVMVPRLLAAYETAATLLYAAAAYQGGSNVAFRKQRTEDFLVVSDVAAEEQDK